MTQQFTTLEKYVKKYFENKDYDYSEMDCLYLFEKMEKEMKDDADNKNFAVDFCNMDSNYEENINFVLELCQGRKITSFETYICENMNWCFYMVEWED